MAERELDDRLKELYDSGKKVYSISKLNRINQCRYQAYLNDVLKIKGKNMSPYGNLGSSVHDCIEGCIKGTNIPSDMKYAIQKELDDLDMFGVDFPKDRNGGDSIRRNWITNMMTFASYFKTPSGKFDTEELLILNLDEEHAIMGYADAIRHQKNGNVWLIDWKTSAQFDKAHLLQAGRQLILYKLALEHIGYTVERCSWCMVKYCETTWKLKNGKDKSKVSEWRNYVKDLKNQIEKFLDDEGIDEIEQQIYISDAIASNSLDYLPENVRNKFKTNIYVRDYEITDELIEETKKYISNTISDFESWGEDESNYPPCDINKNSYFCNTLCNFGGKTGQCKHYVDYCSQFVKEEKEDEDDLF